MGLFSTSEKERQKYLQEQERKEKEKAEKEKRQLQAFVNYYQLTEMDESDLIVLKRITNSMKGNNLMHLGELLSFKGDAQTGYLNTIVEQNFMIIKQLSELNSKLSKIIENK